MKKSCLLILLIFSSLLASSQTFRIYTAKASGNWSNAGTWNSVIRSDNVKKNKYIIPASYTVVSSSGYNYTTLGDVEVVVGGKLRLVSNTIFALTENSSIDVFPDGVIESIGASAIFISNSLKYFSLGNRSLSGPAYTDASIPGFASFTTLASLVRFNGVSKENEIFLQWTAFGELNREYQVEFSSNGSDWKRVGTVPARTGSTEQTDYQFTHRYAPDLAYYRLKQVNADGRFTYSEIVMIENNQSKVTLYLSHRTIKIQVDASSANNIQVNLLDLNGLVVRSRQYHGTSRDLTVDVSDIKTGTYVVQVTDRATLYSVKSLMIF